MAHLNHCKVSSMRRFGIYKSQPNYTQDIVWQRFHMKTGVTYTTGEQYPGVLFGFESFSQIISETILSRPPYDTIFYGHKLQWYDIINLNVFWLHDS